MKLEETNLEKGGSRKTATDKRRWRGEERWKEEEEEEDRERDGERRAEQAAMVSPNSEIGSVTATSPPPLFYSTLFYSLSSLSLLFSTSCLSYFCLSWLHLHRLFVCRIAQPAPRLCMDAHIKAITATRDGLDVVARIQRRGETRNRH